LSNDQTYNLTTGGTACVELAPRRQPTTAQQRLVLEVLNDVLNAPEHVRYEVWRDGEMVKGQLLTKGSKRGA